MPETMPARRFFTPDEYLIIERRAEFKSEYLDGEIFAMPAATLANNQITGNLLMELGQQLRGKPIQPFVSNMRVGVTPRGPYFYPDVLVVCGKPQLRDNTKDCLMNPVVIVEVISPSTETYDRTQKFSSYQRIATLTDFLLVSQIEPRIEDYTRQANGGWLLNTITGMDSKLSVSSIGCDLLSARVYEQVEFEPANPA
jgi:Uma2 family endonuclease